MWTVRRFYLALNEDSMMYSSPLGDAARTRRIGFPHPAGPLRGHIDPTASRRVYSDEEMEFMVAIADYRDRSGMKSHSGEGTIG